MSQIWLPGAGLHYRGVTGGQPRVGTEIWVIEAINKINSIWDPTLLYHLLGNDFVSKCFFAGIFPWSPVAHFCIVKEILEYDHCCNVALHCSHSVTLCPDLLLLNIKIFYWNQQLTICSSVYKYCTISVGFNFSQFPPETSEYFITWIMQMSGCSALINISAAVYCVACPRAFVTPANKWTVVRYESRIIIQRETIPVQHSQRYDPSCIL